jgi:hypothetical protein
MARSGNGVISMAISLNKWRKKAEKQHSIKLRKTLLLFLFYVLDRFRNYSWYQGFGLIVRWVQGAAVIKSTTTFAIPCSKAQSQSDTPEWPRAGGARAGH